ncbi:hypothetical protein KKA53_00955 [Candidatus Dependentiae bacterium]|nr:hypothetical protein [Candidatus Dependentiae bacterium]
MANKSGFTFAEVLLALLVLTGSMYVYSGLQYRAIAKVRKSTGQIDRVFFIKKFLYQLYTKPAKAQKKRTLKLTTPDTAITTHKQKIDPKKSSLKSFAKEIDIIWSQGEWNENINIKPAKITMISFVEKVGEDEK